MSFDDDDNDDDNNNNKIPGKPEEHPGEARNQGTTENSHIGHCTHTSDRTTVKVQNAYHGKLPYMFHEL